MPTKEMHERLDINVHFTKYSNIVEKSNFSMSQHRAEVCANAHNTRVSAPMFVCSAPPSGVDTSQPPSGVNMSNTSNVSNHVRCV